MVVAPSYLENLLKKLCSKTDLNFLALIGKQENNKPATQTGKIVIRGLNETISEVQLRDYLGKMKKK